MISAGWMNNMQPLVSAGWALAANSFALRPGRRMFCSHTRAPLMVAAFISFGSPGSIAWRSSTGAPPLAPGHECVRPGGGGVLVTGAHNWRAPASAQLDSRSEHELDEFCLKFIRLSGWSRGKFGRAHERARYERDGRHTGRPDSGRRLRTSGGQQ